MRKHPVGAGRPRGGELGAGRRGRLLFALVVLALGAAPVPVSRAHSSLVRTQPTANASLSAAPEEIRLWFSEPVETGHARIRVVDDSGRPLEGGSLRSIPGEPTGLTLHLELPGAGRYHVSWRVLSRTEGHVTIGEFSFRVGTGEPAAEAPPGDTAPPATSAASTSPSAVPGEAQLRGLAFLLAAWMVGGALFSRLVVPNLVLPRPLVVAPAALLLLTTVAWTMAWALHVAGGLSGAPELLATRAGRVFLARDLAALATLGSAALRPGVRLWAGLAFLATLSLGAHATATEDPVAPVLDWVHLVAAAAWAGGLGHLVWLAWRRTPGVAWRPVIRRFSNLALVSVGVLAATGLYRAAQEVGGWRGLSGTGFGRLLTLKSALVGFAVVLGLIHLVRGRRRGEGDPGRLRVSLATEATALAVVLLLTGLLTTRTPGRLEPATQALRLDDRAGDWRFALELRPGWAGANEVRVRLGAPSPQDVPRRVQLGLGVEPHPDHLVWVVETDMVPAAPFEFTAVTDRLTVPWDRWSAEVRIWPEGGSPQVGRAAFALQEPVDVLRAPRPLGSGVPLVAVLTALALALGLA
ncbi:MAG: copper resistance protein CopC, partial [Acidimicrobiia bacterium]